MAFLRLSRAIDAIENSLNRLDATKRQGETNNRVKTPHGGKLTDHIIDIVSWVMRTQAIYRKEQLAKLNVVKNKLILNGITG